MKRFHLVLPDETFTDLKEVADARGVTVVELLRRFIRLGLICVEAEEKPGATLVLKQGGREREIVFV